MRPAGRRWRLSAALVGLALVAGGVIAAALTGGSSSGRDGPSAAQASRIVESVHVDPGTADQPIRPGFLGLSIEFSAVRTYTGNDPGRINPVLVRLIENLSPGQAPMLRIGGDSTDFSWVPIPGVVPPRVVSYDLNPSWLASTSALVRKLGARLILGVNLAADETRLAAAEARAYVRSFGRSSIDALEIGNEPNVYGKIALHTPGGVIKVRRRGYGYRAFQREFRRVQAVLPALAVAGPALAAGPIANQYSWIQSLPSFLAGDRRLKILTVHRYPLRNCYVGNENQQYPTVAHLLAPFASTGLASSLEPYVAIAHAHHRALRVDELNSVACRGKSGISDTFASSLWVLDTLFGLARLGVDGVNMHTLPQSAYELFQFSHQGGRWRAFVRPIYYGLQMFAQATPPGSRLLRLAGQRPEEDVSVWATRAPDRLVRVVLINKGSSQARTIALHAPPGSGDLATVERLEAPSVDAGQGITLGGRTYGAETYTGRLSGPRTARLRARGDGDFAIAVPPASAALVTFAP